MNWNYVGRRTAYAFFGSIGVGLFMMLAHACSH
jgi:hypothetical protein